MAGLVLVLMIVTGTLLAMHYTPTSELAFKQVDLIMVDVNYG
jgi:ubiquinol-cytochrome c reductase cytochrome b subunit